MDWRDANAREKQVNLGHQNPVMKEPVLWQPPVIGSYKLNVDASLITGQQIFTLGLLIRDDKGQFVMGKNMKITGEVSVMEAEARGVYEAIEWLGVSGLHQVVIESDSQLMMNAICSEDLYHPEVGHIIDECKEKLKDRADLSIVHVKKQANKTVHLMARVPCLLNSYNIFMSPPDLLLEMLPSEFLV